MTKSLRRTYLLSLGLLITLVLGSIGAPLVSAATSNGAANGFTVSPVLTEITVGKGQSQVIPLTLSNPTPALITAEPVVNDFIAAGDESGTPRLIFRTTGVFPTESFKSIVGPIATTTLAPNRSGIVNVTITVPKNAQSGGYYGAVRFLPAPAGTQSNVGLTASVGSLFLITVPGNLSTKLTVVQFSASDTNGNASSFFTNGQIGALLRLSNSGNIYTQPFGTIVLKNTFGHSVSTTQFNNITPRSSILQNSTRKFVINLPAHKYIGHYTLTASIGYGNKGNNLIIVSAGFWYIPVWLQLIILVIIIIVVVIIYWIVHSIRSRRFRRL